MLYILQNDMSVWFCMVSSDDDDEVKQDSDSDSDNDDELVTVVFSMKNKLEVTGRIVGGLRYLHRCRVVHRYNYFVYILLSMFSIDYRGSPRVIIMAINTSILSYVNKYCYVPTHSQCRSGGLLINSLW